MSWLVRGAQSALFFYLSCAPCSQYQRERQRKRENDAWRLQRVEFEKGLDPNDPTFYRQPSPYRTNEYWAEEIAQGPGPPPQRISKKARQARLEAQKKKDEAAKEDEIAEEGRGSPRAGTVDRNTSSVIVGEVSAVDGVKQLLNKASCMVPGTEAWKRRQREDEYLWGAADGASSKPPSSSPVSSTIKGTESQSTNRFPSLSRPATQATEASSNTFSIKNPPINDLHPPVVSQPQPRSLNRWMLQPPPPAAVMNGYESPSRSRSGSGASSQRSHRARETNLGRKMSNRLMADKLSRIDDSSLGVDFPRSRASTAASKQSASRRRDMATDDSMNTVLHDRVVAPAALDLGADADDEDENVTPNAVPDSPDSGVDFATMQPTLKERRPKGTLQQDFAFPAAVKDVLEKHNQKENRLDKSTTVDTARRVRERSPTRAGAQPRKGSYFFDEDGDADDEGLEAWEERGFAAGMPTPAADRRWSFEF